MNPMTNVKNIKKLSEQDIKLGGKSSWHDQYKDSAWIFIGGLPYDLTEGDVICVFSQYGEVVNINLVRDKDSGKQKGFCFLCYEDQRSTILAVDNLNGIKLLSRTLRVDHVENYKVPKEGKKNPIDDETRLLREEGCAPKAIVPPPVVPIIKTEDNIVGGVRLPPRLPIGPIKTEPKESESETRKSKKKHKKNKDNKVRSKVKKEKKSKKKKRKRSTSSSETDTENDSDSETSDSEEERRDRRKKKHR